MADLEGQLRQWAAGLDNEVEFWRSWFATRGLDWPDDYAARFDPDLPLEAELAEIARQSGRSPVRVLDVGAGPVTNVGRRAEGLTIEVQACDPLARRYDELIAEAGVTPPVRTVFAPGEDLSIFFAPSSFDIVHCRNALDHSMDPLRSLEEMLRVVRVGGAVYLRHHRNEAERERYVGLHQFNIDERAGELVFWNQGGSWRPLAHMPVRTSGMVRADGGDTVAVITKLGEFPAWSAAPRTAERLRDLLESTVMVLSKPT